jgi:hypothetical protein
MRGGARVAIALTASLFVLGASHDRDALAATPPAQDASSSDASDSSDATTMYTYEIENAGAHPEWALVIWPRDCTATGEPLGTVDLALNPDWAARAHDVDYEVLTQGRSYELENACAEAARIYALPASAFPLGAREATADDTGVGQPEAGARFPILPALDAIDRKQRIDFFAKDPRVLRSSFRFASSKGSHAVLTASAFDEKAGTFTVAPPVDAGAADAGDVDAGVLPAESPPAEAPDLGTRWVFVAAVGGILAGALIAYRRKNAKK